VLVDRDTASAAEILAGVLQERAGAVVVGAPTWGKGYTQLLRTEREQGYAVQFTNQIWTLSSGRHLARSRDGSGGIQPDVPLELSPGVQFQADLLARQRAALHAHKDGTPLEWLDTVRRSDLPPLSADPALLYGELILRALIHRDQPGG
jgi:C-terminal processing protease CtpA/Prc